MDSIIEILFDALEPDRQSPKERAAIHAAEENLRQVKEKLTEEEFESLAATFLDIGSINCQDSFARGLRLGMRLCWRDCAGNPPATRLRLAALPPLTRGARGLWGPHNDSSKNLKDTGAALGKIRPLAPLVKGGRATPAAWRGDSAQSTSGKVCTKEEEPQPPYPSRIPRSSFKSEAMYSAPAFSCSARLP